VKRREDGGRSRRIVEDRKEKKKGQWKKQRRMKNWLPRFDCQVGEVEATHVGESAYVEGGGKIDEKSTKTHICSVHAHC
jgi:hypothetical protein